MTRQEHDPPRQATEEQITGDAEARRQSEPAEGGYGAELEEEPEPAASSEGDPAIPDPSSSGPAR